jgi:glycosyltransferase involved in cell wall biosynthesis
VAVPQPKILIAVHSAQRGGAELIALEHARYLKRWFRVLAAVPEGPLRASFAAEAELVPPAPSLPLWGASPGRWAWRSGRTVKHAVRLANLIRKREIGLVLVSSTVQFAPVLAARMARVPVIVQGLDALNSRLRPAVFLLIAALADMVVVISRDVERQFRHTLRARVVRRPHGVEIPDWTIPVRDGGPLRLCVLGTVEHRKGQDVALEALAGLRRTGIDARLDLVGRGAESEFGQDLQRRVQALGLDDHVTFMGQVSDVDRVLKQTDVLLMPSRAEPLGLSALEASARAIPVVASEVGGLPEVVNDGETGFLTPAGDAGALAEAIRRLGDDPAAAHAMGQRGRAHVESNFSLSQSLEALRADIDRELGT